MTTSQVDRNQIKTSHISIKSGNLAADDGKIPDPETFLETKWNSAGYYDWPIHPDHLATMLDMNPHHQSAISCKTETAVMGYRPHEASEFAPSDNDSATQSALKKQGFESFFSTYDMSAAIFDFCYSSNSYIRNILDNKGDIARREHVISRTMRNAKAGKFTQVQGKSKKNFAADRIVHIKKYGPASSIYGCIDYYSIYLSIVLNRKIKLSNYRFLNNGANFGNIILMNLDFEDRDDETGISEDEENINKQITEGATPKGEGKNLLLNLGGVAEADGKPVDIDKLIKITPKGELLAKISDGYSKITNFTQNEILSVHRVPPEILAVVLEQKYSGDLKKIVKMYNKLVVNPIHRRFENEFNKGLPPEKWITFDAFNIDLDDSQKENVDSDNQKK
jgi:capsid portal protein